MFSTLKLHSIIVQISFAIFLLGAQLGKAELSYNDARKIALAHKNTVTPDFNITTTMVQDFSAQMQAREPNHRFAKLDYMIRNTKPSKSDLESLRSSGVEVKLSWTGWIKKISGCRDMVEIKDNLSIAANDYGMSEYYPKGLFNFIIDLLVAHENSNSPPGFTYSRNGSEMCVVGNY